LVGASLTSSSETGLPALNGKQKGQHKSCPLKI